MRCERLTALAAVLLSGCAGSAVTQAELTMSAHPHAAQYPAMYLERAGRLLVYEGDLDRSDLDEDSGSGGVGTGGGMGAGTLSLSNFTFEVKLRLKIFDPAAVGATLRERLPEGKTPQDIEVRLTRPDGSVERLAAGVEGRFLTVPLQQVPAGSVIDCKYVIRDTDLRVIPVWEFQGVFPTLEASFRIRAALQRRITFNAVQRAGAVPGAPHERKTRDPHGIDGRWIIWQLDELPAIAATEPSAAILVTEISAPPRMLEMGLPSSKDSGQGKTPVDRKPRSK